MVHWCLGYWNDQWTDKIWFPSFIYCCRASSVAAPLQHCENSRLLQSMLEIRMQSRLVNLPITFYLAFDRGSIRTIITMLTLHKRPKDHLCMIGRWSNPCCSRCDEGHANLIHVFEHCVTLMALKFFIFGLTGLLAVKICFLGSFELLKKNYCACLFSLTVGHFFLVSS